MIPPLSPPRTQPARLAAASYGSVTPFSDGGILHLRKVRGSRSSTPEGQLSKALSGSFNLYTTVLPDHGAQPLRGLGEIAVAQVHGWNEEHVRPRIEHAAVAVGCAAQVQGVVIERPLAFPPRWIELPFQRPISKSAKHARMRENVRG